MVYGASRGPDRRPLSEQEATQLLRRASEVDAALRAGRPVEEVRAAALEAGIAPEAFEAALAELRVGQVPRAPDEPERQRRSARRYGLVAALLLVLLLGGLVMVAPRAPAGPPMAEEVVGLRCLSTDDALTGVELILREEPASTVKAREGARVISIRTAPALLERARAWLAEHDAGCAAP